MRGQSAIRLGVDPSIGHGCFGPTVAVTASIDIYVDQIAAVRLTDMYAPHCCPPPVGCHVPSVARGSRTTYYNMLARHKQGDPLTCGDTSGIGSLTTFTG